MLGEQSKRGSARASPRQSLILLLRKVFPVFSWKWDIFDQANLHWGMDRCRTRARSSGGFVAFFRAGILEIYLVELCKNNDLSDLAVIIVEERDNNQGEMASDGLRCPEKDVSNSQMILRAD